MQDVVNGFLCVCSTTYIKISDFNDVSFDDFLRISEISKSLFLSYVKEQEISHVVWNWLRTV